MKGDTKEREIFGRKFFIIETNYISPLWQQGTFSRQNFSSPCGVWIDLFLYGHCFFFH